MKKAGTGQVLTDKSLPSQELAKSWAMRWFFIILAWIFLILGTVGLLLPGLPAFDFYFLAAIFAAKGSKRLHDWIVNNKIIAPILQQWQTHRTLPLRVKLISLMSMCVGAVLLIVSVPHVIAVSIIILVMVCVQIWLWTKT
ncbi:YbaN family protein [Acinetobacter celticus]|uniref:DUF454 domain-containing protein n=1 Tax=Acinetobacter celticus TaxID=1891224 RepID=A0A1C3CUW2_9GAMM|nr:YbaN family protein [Acinetobacter celticus]ODA12507.1 hypothetical protein BBP83_08000 [Acinetobacter celticus]